MTITTTGTSNTTIGPAQYADMTQVLAPKFLVDGPNDLIPSYSNGTAYVSQGAGWIAGARVNITGSDTVSIPSVSSGTKMYAICIRVDWSKGATDSASLVAIAGTATVPVNSSRTPNTSAINRIPGVMYDAVVAVVTRKSGTTTAVSFTDYRMWGGDGGPIRVTDAGFNDPRYYDARIGTMIGTDRDKYRKRLDNDGVWRPVGSDSNPWKLWTPTFRYYKDGWGTPGISGGAAVALGTQGTYFGRYRIDDGVLTGYVQVTTGSGANFGSGFITVDLPVPCAQWVMDSWSNGHLFTDTSFGGDKKLDWPSQVLVKGGWTRGMLFVPTSGDYSDMQLHMATKPGMGAGSGYPMIVNGPSTGAVYTYTLQYPVE